MVGRSAHSVQESTLCSTMSKVIRNAQSGEESTEWSGMHRVVIRECKEWSGIHRVVRNTLSGQDQVRIHRVVRTA